MYRVGDIVETGRYGEVTVISTNGWRDITIQFQRTGTKRKTNSSDLRKGLVKDTMQPTLFEVGYLGEDWQEGKARSEPHKLWRAMLDRVFGKNTNNKSYVNVSVCDKFLNFSEFEKWVLSCKYYHKDWELDKDLLSGSEKIYSETTCCFIPREINLAIVKKSQGKHLKGVRSSLDKYYASCRRGGGKEYLGTFDTELEAFLAYKHAKEAYIKELASKWKDQIDPRVYEALMKYEVEITD